MTSYLTSQFNIRIVLCLFLSVMGPYIVFRYAMYLLVTDQTIAQWLTEEPTVTIKSHLNKKIDKQLSANPDIIFIGSSVAVRGIDPKGLEKELQLPKNSIEVLHSGGAAAPTVYAMIREGIFANGYKPKLIVVTNTPRLMVSNNVYPLRHLLGLVTGEDVHLQRVLEEQGVVQTPFKQNKNKLQQDYLDHIRKLFGESIFDIPDETVVQTLDELFSFDNRRDIKNNSVIPIVIGQQDQVEQNALPGHPIPNSEAQLIKQTIELVHKHQANIVFVELPVRYDIIDKHLLPNDSHLDLINTIGENKAGYLSYFKLNEPGIFVDAFHLSPRGRQLITDRLAKDLRDLNFLGDAIVAPKIPAFLKEVHIEWSADTPAPKDHLGAQRTWLPSMESVDVVIQNEWNSTVVRISASIGISGKPPSVMLNGNPLDLQEQQHPNGLWEATVNVETLSPGDRIQIKNTSQRMYYLHSLELDSTEFFTEQQSLPLLDPEVIQVTNNASHLLTIPFIPVSDPADPIQKLHASLLVGKLKQFSKVTTNQLIAKNIVSGKKSPLCVPLVLQENNRNVSVPPITYKAFSQQKEQQPLQHLFNSGNIYLLPRKSGITINLSVTVKEDHTCNGGWWFYPKDHLEIPVPEIEMTSSYTKLILQGHNFGDGTWTVTISSENTVYLEESFTSLEYQRELILDKLLYTTDPSLKITITGSNFSYLSNVTLAN